MDARTFWIVLLAGIILNACATKKDEAVVDIAAAQQAIKDRSAAWMQAVQAKDAASVDQYTKTHTVLAENMLKPLIGGQGSC